MKEFLFRLSLHQQFLFFLNAIFFGGGVLVEFNFLFLLLLLLLLLLAAQPSFAFHHNMTH